MAGSKNAKGKDFQKVKLKVGKIKKKGLNFTDTSFKSKKIVIREQLKAEAKCLKEQFPLAMQKLNSANASVVTDGLNAIVRILDLLASDQRQALVHRLAALTSRCEVVVRDGAISVLNRALLKIPPEQRKGFAAKLVLNLQCAMTSLEWDVKRSSLQLLEMLLRHVPDEVARNFSIMENLMDMVSSTQQGTRARKLDMELKCSSDHLRLWRDVTRILTRLVQGVVQAFFSGGKQYIVTCTGLHVAPPIRWFAPEGEGVQRSLTHQEGAAVVQAFLPVLLAMWAGIESCATAKALLTQDLFSCVSSTMLTLVEWANLCNSTTTVPVFHQLADEVTNFFKRRFPITLEGSPCADTNLRVAKVMIMLHGGKDTGLNQALFVVLQKHKALLSDVKLTLDVAAMAVKNTPGVLEYINGLFFVKTALARRPFYKFYLSVLESRISDPHLDYMLRRVSTFISKIIIQYPDQSRDEVRFLEHVHSYMLPAYIGGIGKLPLSALEQILRITHKQSPMALRLILDQKMLSRQHLKIITDRWQEGDLDQQEMLFVVGHLTTKLEDVYSLMVSEPTNVAAIDLHIKLVQLVAEFILCLYLDLDSDENAHFSRTTGSHPQQKHLHYFEQIHNNVIFLNADDQPDRKSLDRATRAIVLRDEYLRDTVMDLLRELLQLWAMSDIRLTVSSVTLSNILFLMNCALDFDDDSLDGPVDKLINQLFVSQFLRPAAEQDQELIGTCADYYQHFGLESMLQDLEQVMKSKPEECDDRLHAAFAKSTKFFLERRLIPKETHYQDLVDDAMRIADASEESSDSAGDSSA